jgi:hypothetical protein
LWGTPFKKTLENLRPVLTAFADWNLVVASDERDRLTLRADGLRRLREGIDDGMARAAITAEMAKHEALITEIDNATAPKKSPADPD